MNSTTRLLLAGLCAVLPCTTQSAPIADNLANTAAGVGEIVRNAASAQSFTTGGKSFLLDALIARLVPPPGGGEVEFQLRANNLSSNTPGAILHAWPNNHIVSGSFAVDVATPDGGGVVLAPDTTYWFIVRTTSPSPVGWNFAPGTPLAGPGAFTGRAYAQVLNANPSWQLSGGSAHHAAITGTEIVPSLRIAAAFADKPEGTSSVTPFVFNITRGEATGGVTTVNYSVTGSGGVAAEAGDFAGDTFPTGILTFGPGDQQRDLIVLVKGDGTIEQNEGFTVTLSNASGNAQITGATASGTIHNDDATTLVLAAYGGTPPSVAGFDLQTPAPGPTFTAFDAAFTGGVRVATGDINGDGTADFIAGAAGASSGQVKVFNGTNGAELRSFTAFSPSFTGGVFVAAGDVNGDGKADIITGAGAGGGPHVKVFNGATGAQLKSFFAFDTAFTGGVSVAAGDVNGDGKDDIITGAGAATGAGAGPHVKVFSGANGAVLHNFLAFDPAFTGGVNVAAGDVNGDGVTDIIAGAATGPAHVRVFSGAGNTPLHSFFAYDVAFTGGVRVAAGDINGDGLADIITGAGPGGGPQVKVFHGATLAPLADFLAFTPGNDAGIFPASRPTPQVPPRLGIQASGTGKGKVTSALIPPLVHIGAGLVEVGRPVEAGTLVTLQATPAAGSLFNGWQNEEGELVSQNPAFSFRMTPNHTVRATFVPNPFAGQGGTFSGLVTDEQPAGFFTGKISDTGAVTGSILIGNRRIPLKGSLLGSGEFFSVIQSGKTDVFEVHLAFNPMIGRINGTVEQTAGAPGAPLLSADISASEHVFSAKEPSPDEGTYTMLFGPANGVSNYPPGHGWGRVVVNKTGAAKFAGKLADGTPATFSTIVNVAGQWPFFAPLYKGAGSISGNLLFNNLPNSDLAGPLQWFKPAGLPGQKTYADGFSGGSSVLGVRYAKPEGAALPSPFMLLVSAPAGELKLGRNTESLPPLITQAQGTISEANKVTLPADDRALKLNVNASTGLINGSHTETIAGRKIVFPFTGAVLRAKGTTPNSAGGHLIRGNVGGRVDVLP